MKIRALRGAGTDTTLNIRFRRPALPEWLTSCLGKIQSKLPFLKDVRVRTELMVFALVIVLAEVLSILQPYFNQPVYALGQAGSLLAPIVQPVADKLTYNAQQQVFNFNQGYTPPSQNASQTNGIQIEATANQDLSKGVSVTDPVNNVNFTMTPQFATWNGQQDGNRIVYPLKDGDGWVVYSMHSIGVKEDILLNKASGDTSTFSYKLGLGDNLAARLQSDGDLGIYGNTLLSGNISTGSSKDAALLQKARQNAPKNKLLFTIPKPTVTALDQGNTGVSAAYALDGSNLKVTVSGLSNAHYPLTIDPSIYVTSAQQFMAGNNETNVNFDVADQMIQEGSTTGAMLNSWNPTLPLNSGSWGQATAVAGGNIYVVGGTNAEGSATTTVRWAQFNSSTGAIQSANPGAGICNGWCTQNSYALPSARNDLSLVAYNGYLYAIGGENSDCTAASGTGDGGICNTVYIAKLGANGEPQLWNPDNGRQSYWYRDTGLSSPRSYTAAVAYENRMYLLGGKTSSGGVPSISNTAQVADISATGKLGSWSNSTALPYNVYGYGAETYNGRIYLIGGSSSASSTLSDATPTNQVYYDKINGNGSLNAWARTTNLVGARFTDGGNFTTILGGYIYASGGCSAVDANGYCSDEASNTQLASINADGSLDQWQNDTVSNSRMGQSTVSWQNNIYNIGGCTSQNTLTGQCTDILSAVNYGIINPGGDISNVTQSVASGTSQCTGNKPSNCDLPSTNSVGHLLNATAVINGYLYIAGGCTAADCSNTAHDTAYAAIGGNGALTAPANCANDDNTLDGSWCVDSTHSISPGAQGNGSDGVAAAGVAVSGNTMYLVGGKNSNGLTGGIYYATFNADGSLSSNGWQYEPMSTTGAAPVAYDFAYAQANPASADTAPGNLYIFGGCTGLSGTTCSSYTDAVYKCNILPDATISGCSTSGQLQIGTVAGASGRGLAGTGGTVYANYVYLVGGQAPGMAASSDIYYAKIDNSNNVVAASGGNSWSVASNKTPTSSAYGSAFGYNGYLYDIGGYDGANGALNTVAFAKINVANGNIGAFTTSATTIGAVWGESVPINGANAYVLGGCTAGSPPGSCSSIQANVQTFQIYNDDSGATAAYSKASNTYGTDANRMGAGSTVLDGYIYVAGGCVSSSDCTTAVDDVSYAPIGANGNIGTWSSTSGALPAVRAWGKLEAAGSTLYFIGGQDSSGAAQSTVYYATPSSGNIGSWGTSSKGLGDTGSGGRARTKLGAAVWDNRLYVTGGMGSGAGCSNGVCNTVFVSPRLSSGGNITTNWTSSTAFNVARSGSTVAAYDGNLYVFGGYDGSNYLQDGQYAKINASDGNVGHWSYTTSLPTALSGADGFAANGYMYIIGGTTDGTACTTSTLVAPISANTTTSSGNNPTGIGTWFQANRHYTGGRYGAAADYYNGKVYVLGGACGSNSLAYANAANGSAIIEQASLLSQPQVAQYSIMFNTGTNVFPNYWLLNGTDNATDAAWQLQYRSMTQSANCAQSPMSTWGQTTNVGSVALGAPGTYSPLDGNGNNTHCAQYYDLSVSINSSQTYGFPDDTTDEPTIADLSIQFTPNPSQQLMHGGTFINGQKQPDNTPYYSH